jgi:uncharacterized protein DUF4058
MPGPFPGMDPYLESQGFWQDFHTSLITYCREALNAALPDHYAALIEERIKDPDEVPERWIEIKRLPELSLVTAIEILSPTNKSGVGRSEYLHERRQFLDQPVHLVEIDLLLRGIRVPMGAPLPPGDYYALVSRSEQRDHSNVYAWSVRRPLPTIPIPLAQPDPDISLNLASVVERAYEQGRYARLVNYTAAVDLPLAPEDRAWAEDLAHAGTQ